MAMRLKLRRRYKWCRAAAWRHSKARNVELHWLN